MKFNIKSKKGFTLIELLVVIGILAVLAAIAIPSVAGLIDRANVSADNSNATAMTNAIEQFTSEFELVKQDIVSGTLDETDLDSVQGRIFNIFEITMRSQVVHLENEDGHNGYGVNINTKYPVNEKTFKSVITHYLKTTSDTFIPKQSDMAFYYSPEIGVVIVAEDGSTTDELNEVASVDEDGVKVSNKGFVTLSATPLADDTEDNNIQWINLTLNALNEKNGTTTTNVYVSTNTKNQYTTLRKDVLGYQEYDSEGSGLFVPGTDEYIKITVNGKQVDATWRHLIQGDYIRIVNGVIQNGSNASAMTGEFVIGSEIYSIIGSDWNSQDAFLYETKITSVVLKEGISSIGAWAFSRATSLEKISIPSTVTTIEPGICSQALKLTEFVVSEENMHYTSKDGVLFSKDMKTLVAYPSAKTESTYSIPNGVETIDKFAFHHATKLINVYFSDSLTSIKKQAFENCYNLENVYINDNCILNDWAIFRGCQNVYFHINPTNPNNIVYDNGIFDKNMRTVYAMGKQDDGIFEIPEGVVNIYMMANYGVHSVIIPKSVKGINENAMYTSIKNIYYCGSENEFNSIETYENSSLWDNVISNATIIYNYNT